MLHCRIPTRQYSESELTDPVPGVYLRQYSIVRARILTYDGTSVVVLVQLSIL